MSDRHRVVIVGAGFGGLAAARELASADVEITVVDQRNHHTFQPLLYQVATAGLDADDVCHSTRGIFGRQTNARALQAMVTGVDLERRQVHLTPGPPLPYDSLVLALGGITNDFGTPGVEEFAFGLKSAADATAIRTHLLHAFEQAERHDPPEPALTGIVVVGGGPTGVEMAGGFAELFHRVLRHDYPGIDPSAHRIVLVEAQDRLLGTFRPRLGEEARRRLEALGVEVRLGVTVERVEAQAVRLGDGSHLDAATTVWAAGIQPHPIAASLGVDTERGRIVVDEHLRLPGRPEVHVIGDLAATRLEDGSLAPQVAAMAIQGGRHSARIINAALADGSVRPFRYRDKGSMATIGRNAAVVELPPGIAFGGFFGWVAWLTLHLVMLIGFRNRANVLVNWAWNYLTYDRGSRVIVEPDPVPQIVSAASTTSSTSASATGPSTGSA